MTKDRKEARKELMDTVMEMIITGYTYSQIAHKLGINKRTVTRYVKERTGDEVESMRVDAVQQMAEMELARKKRTQKLWTIALDSKIRERDRMKAMQLLQNEEVLKIKRQQLIGMLPAEAPLVAIQNNSTVEINSISDSIRRVHPELLEKFSKNKVELINVKQENTKSNQEGPTGTTQED